MCRANKTVTRETALRRASTQSTIRRFFSAKKRHFGERLCAPVFRLVGPGQGFRLDSCRIRLLLGGCQYINSKRLWFYGLCLTSFKIKFTGLYIMERAALRTKRARNCGSRETTLAMVYKLLETAQKRWKRIRVFNVNYLDRSS